MNYEMNDYRKHPKKPKLGKWPFWVVPELWALQYVTRLALVLFVLPFLFGMALTPGGIFLMFIVYDYVTYRSLKTAFGLE